MRKKNDTKIFYEKTGEEILEYLNTQNISIDLKIKKILIEESEKNLNWYYYPHDMIVTSYMNF